MLQSVAERTRAKRKEATGPVSARTRSRYSSSQHAPEREERKKKAKHDAPEREEEEEKKTMSSLWSSAGGWPAAPEVKLSLSDGRTTTAKRISWTEAEDDFAVWTIDSFLTGREVAALMGHRATFTRSRVLTGDDDHARIGKNRTSYEIYFPQTHPLVTKISARLASVSTLSSSRIEGGGLVRYEVGQEFKPHFDSTDDTPTAGSRLISFIIYLNDLDDSQGGATHFPALRPPLAVRPKAGMALLWNNYHRGVNGLFDDRAEHCGLPVLSGSKFVLVFWGLFSAQ